MAVNLLTAYRSAMSGLDSVDGLDSLANGELSVLLDSVGGAVDDVPEETAAERLQDAADAFENTADRLGGVAMWPLRKAPVLGRQLESARALAEAGELTARSGSEAFDALDTQLAKTAQTPADRLLAAKEAERILTDLQRDLDDVDPGPTEKLLPPVAEARNRFVEQFSSTVHTLDEAVVTVQGVNDFLEGPTDYLVLAANNAEMRAGSGMFLQVGTVSVVDGVFTMGSFTPAKELLLQDSGATLDPDIASRWGWLEPDREWRNLGLSPRFDESARMAAEMWSASGRGEVDGVIAVDVAGLEELLEITGPVEVGTETGSEEISADTVAEDLLIRQYEDFVDQRDERRDRLGKVAAAVFDAFNTRSWSASELLGALRRSGEGRHIMLWSSVPEQQAAWDELGANGEVTDATLMLNLLNRGGNKLDQFLEIDATLTSTPGTDGPRYALDVLLSNDAPRTLPYYVEGPYPGSEIDAGDYLGILSLTLPAGAGSPTMEGGEILISGADGPTRMLATEVLVPLDSDARFRIEFDLPESWRTLEVLPSARIPPITWHAGTAEWTDTKPVVVELDML